MKFAKDDRNKRRYRGTTPGQRRTQWNRLVRHNNRLQMYMRAFSGFRWMRGDGFTLTPKALPEGDNGN